MHGGALIKKKKKELHFVAVSSRSKTGNLDGTIGQTALFVVLDAFDHVLLLLMGKIILRCTLNTNGMANLVVLLLDKEAFFDILYT